MLWNKEVVWGRNVRVYNPVNLRIGRHGKLDLGDDVRISSGTDLLADGSMRIGRGTVIEKYCVIACLDSLEIGDDCLIANMVSIRDHDHRWEEGDRKIREQGYKTAPVRIGDNVWIGDKVTVTSGVNIGDNSIIGANAVVTKDVPANVVAAGVPARVIRTR